MDDMYDKACDCMDCIYFYAKDGHVTEIFMDEYGKQYTFLIAKS